MSNNSRPYRATITGPLRTTHYDYPSKEERGSWSHTPAKFTTVTSRKPVTRGEPVCWVNVFAESHRPSAHTTKVLADQYGQDRLHCIPVYLPGEGAVTVSDMAVNSVSLAAQLRLANEHIARLSLERAAMTTETTFYRVRRTVRREDGSKYYEWLRLEGGTEWITDPGLACAWRWLDGGGFGALASAREFGGTVVTVRHKLVPAKPRTHDRAWALRQLAKGRNVGNVTWLANVYVRMCEVRGISLFGAGGGEAQIGCALKKPDGYTLWQEPAK